MNKTEIWLVTSVILIVALVAANVWVYTIQQNEIDTLRNELNDLRGYVSNHSYNNSDYNNLVNQKIQLETWLANNLTIVNSLESQNADFQNQTMFQSTQITDLQTNIDSLNNQIHFLYAQIESLNGEIADLASILDLYQGSQGQLSHQISYLNLLNVTTYNRTSTPPPFFDQIVNVLFVDNSSNFLGSLAGNLRLSMVSETSVQTSVIFSFLGRKDSTFNVDNVTLTAFFYGPIVGNAGIPPPPGLPHNLYVQTVRSGECVTLIEKTEVDYYVSRELYFYLGIRYWREMPADVFYDAFVIRSSKGEVWKSEETFDVGMFGIGFRDLSELEGKTESQSLTVVVHET